MQSAASTSTGLRSAICRDRDEARGHRRRQRNGWRISAAVSARGCSRRSCDVDRAQEPRDLRCQAHRDPPSRFRGLLCARRRALGPGRRGLLPGRIYRRRPGRRAPQNHCGLHGRVRASASRQQSQRDIRVLERGGADPTGRSRLPFARYEGEAENALAADGFPHVYMFRPAYIYPVQPRREPNFSYRVLRAIYPAFRVLFPNRVIRAGDLARTMVDAAMRGTARTMPVSDQFDGTRFHNQAAGSDYSLW
jgi:hypothetical protein